MIKFIFVLFGEKESFWALLMIPFFFGTVSVPGLYTTTLEKGSFGIN